MQNFNINPKFKNIISSGRLAGLLENVKTIAFRNTVKFQEYFPIAAADNGIYSYTHNFFDSWHGGWWTGIFYMLYEAFGDERFRHFADSYSSRFYALIKNNRIIHREMGFIYLPICVPDILINHNSEAVESVILAAEYMVEAFRSNRVIGSTSSHKIYFVAADAINSRIIRLAGGISINSKFKDVERGYVSNCFKHNITSDGKCYMRVGLDVQTHQMRPGSDDLYPYGFARYGDYIRPYAWLALGLALHYVSDGVEEYEQKLYRVIKYFLSISGDSLCMLAPGDEKSRSIIDTTSASIFVCAFAEILKKLDTAHERYEFYYNLLKKWFDFLTEFALLPVSGNQGFLDKGVILGGIQPDGGEVKNSCNICGDYFYLEALMHMTDGFESCWNVDRLYKNS